MIAANRPKFIDPVCGTTLDPERTFRFAQHRGRTYGFCSPRCKNKFNENPEEFKAKGFIGRFLDRLARSKEKEFGPHGPPRCY